MPVILRNISWYILLIFIHVWLNNCVDKSIYVTAAKNKTEEIRSQLFSQLNRVDNASEPFVSWNSKFLLENGL